MKYRRPYGTAWESLSLERALDMIADRVIETRRKTWESTDEQGRALNRTLGIASLGGATLDIEENYLMKKLYTALGVVEVENQARVCHSPTVAALGTSFGRGGATTFQHDLMNSDCIVVMGSNMAEAHPVGFQWVMEARERGATIVHVDPRFTRTSAVADIHVAIRPGTDVAFLGGIANYILTHDADFREYVVNYSNAPVIIQKDFRDTDELDGFFSGWNAEKGAYDIETWQYEGLNPHAASGQRYGNTDIGQNQGAHGAQLDALEHGHAPARDLSLQDPRCVFQILKRHYARYTPGEVARICGIRPEELVRVAECLIANSGRERTSAFTYALGWTNHTIGVQMIRAACVVQTLLGNIGRPGGGIMALRGHASIQGSTDIPTLYNLLPGYLPMPRVNANASLRHYVENEKSANGYWAEMEQYAVSLLKAWFGDRATAANEYLFPKLPRIDKDDSHYASTFSMVDGKTKGYFIVGENPAVGSANGGLQREALASLEWLVVRDFSETESASFWHDGPEIETGQLRPSAIATEVFWLPAASHVEKKGTFTNTDRLLQYRFKAVEPKGDARSDLGFFYHLGKRIRAKLEGSTRPEDELIHALAWEYPTEGPHEEPDADAVLAEINGFGPDGKHLPAYTELKADGSTSCGCWIYCGVYKDGVNQAARRKPQSEQHWVAPEWCWSWPANRRLMYNRASADPAGRPWSERKKYVWWDEERGEWTGYDVPDFKKDMRPDYVPPKDAKGPTALSGTDPFIMQDDGVAWLFVPSGLVDGPLPTHYEPKESPVRNDLYKQQSSPALQHFDRPDNPYHPDPQRGGADPFPFVLTTYRVTEHFTAGGMTRTVPHLGELIPELFCEVSPQLAHERGLVNGEWATIVTARAAIEARVLVTERMRPFGTNGTTVHVVGLPFHFGPRGVVRGDVPNDLLPVALDPNTHIQESKALTCDIVAGRRPRGAERVRLVNDYRARAGLETV